MHPTTGMPRRRTRSTAAAAAGVLGVAGALLGLLAGKGRFAAASSPQPAPASRSGAFVGPGPATHRRTTVAPSPVLSQRPRPSPPASPFVLGGPAPATALHAAGLFGFLDNLFAPPAPKRKNATETHEVVVVGAGVAGLVAAKELAAQGKDVLVVEAGDRVGGRVQTDEYKGFLLDRGFQVFIEAYPAVKRQLDYQALDLQSFWPGALVRAEGKFATVADPFRRPQDLVKGLLAPIGSLTDKIKVGLLRFEETSKPLRRVFAGPETDTLTYLTKTKGFSSAMVDRFFKPFYQGIYLAPLSEQSSRMFEFVFKMFSEGGISLPARGIRAVPEQLAAGLPQGTLRLGMAARSVMEGQVELADGRVIAADAVVVATEEASARKLLSKALAKERSQPLGGRASTCLYYSFEGKPPIREPLLILNGEGPGLAGSSSNPAGVGSGGSNKKPGVKVKVTGKKPPTAPKPKPAASPPTQAAVRPTSPVNNVVFLSSIAPSYAPAGQTLVSVTVVGSPSTNDGLLDKQVRAQLVGWFGQAQLNKWELLRIYRVPYAQPKQTPPTGASFVQPAEVGDEPGLFVAGDYRNTATLNGAFESGERAAKAVLAHLQALAPEKRRFKGGGGGGGGGGGRGGGRGGGASPQREKTAAPPSFGAASMPSSPVTPATISTASFPSSPAAGRAAPSTPRRAPPSPTRQVASTYSRFRAENERGRASISELVSSMSTKRGSPKVQRFREEERARGRGVTASAAAAANLFKPRPPAPLPDVEAAVAASRFREEQRQDRRAPAASTTPPAAAAAAVAPPARVREMTSSSSSSGASSTSSGGSRFRREERRGTQ